MNDERTHVMSNKLVTAVTTASIALLISAACGSTPHSGFDDSTDGTNATSSSGGPNGGDNSSGGLGGGLGGDTSGTGGDSDAGLGQCGAQTQSAKQLPVDILIMLDASGSMMERTGLVGTGPTKWSSVKTALNSFISDPKSAGLGVGLQVFPIEHPGAPAKCTTNDQCTVGGVSLGRCALKACVPPSPGTPIQLCDTAADCPGRVACRQIGDCVQNGAVVGVCLADDPDYGFCLRGFCRRRTSSSCENSECIAADYSPPKVPIAVLPGNAAALTSSINSIANPKLDAATPTSMAVQSGITIAKEHAAATPGHSVVVVLATDGFPTQCAPLDIPAIAALAASGVNGTTPIKTFVIGVFTDADQAKATKNLDAIAAGGGTSKALVIKTGGNVAADFQKALDTIRSSSLPCEYGIPDSQGGQQDFEKVNVQHTAKGVSKVLAYKPNAAACANGAGWYYDVDPANGGTPTKIALCPSTCDTVKAGVGDAKIEILLGCKTVVK
jgi:hypothetical protein